jgi:ppGpp synthetase/RelA/SpoT-type nucleotidyltranferase
MELPPLPDQVVKDIEEMVANVYIPRRTDFAKLAKRVENDLVEHNELRPLIHSTKQREKDPDHLKDKLLRKAREAQEEGKGFPIAKENLFKKLGDLAGVRLLHIHTGQLSKIHPAIIKILRFHKYKLREKPLVYVWDVERRQELKDLGLKVIVRPNMYTSVHYVVEPFWEKLACEIQVRTLAEELWGEVSHTINYPHKTDSVACVEQLAALARVASGCTRLVDSIFASDSEHKNRKSASPTINS